MTIADSTARRKVNIKMLMNRKKTRSSRKPRRKKNQRKKSRRKRKSLSLLKTSPKSKMNLNLLMMSPRNLSLLSLLTMSLRNLKSLNLPLRRTMSPRNLKRRRTNRNVRSMTTIILRESRKKALGQAKILLKMMIMIL